jgi:beta-lactamase class A
MRHLKEISRLEAFSDAVFAFALTLLVVSLEVPSSYAELMRIMRGFVPFACTFALVTWIWYEHNKFFRRYGMEDPFTVFINGILLFLVLIFVYPLKFMATMVFARFGIGAPVVIDIRNENIPTLMAVYSLGFVVLFVSFALLYWHAWRRRDALALNEEEQMMLKSSLGHHVISISIGLVSVFLALMLPVRWSWLAGPLYALMGPFHGWWGHRSHVRVERLRAKRAAGAGALLVLALVIASGHAEGGPLRSAQPQGSQTPRQRLDSAIERIVRSVNATWGIYAKSIETGEEIAIDADRQMDTMSVIKIPLMVEVFQQIRDGRFGLADKYTLTKEDVLPGTGIMRSLEPGAVLTVKDLITLMIIVSDNTATDVLYRMVGGVEAVNRRMEALGLSKTRAPAPSRAWFDALRAAPSAAEFHRAAKHPYGLSTPREIGMLLERLERGTLVDKAASDEMLQVMRGQIYRSRIPRLVSGFRIPHKTGDFLPYIGNDVGVLESQGTTIVLSVFTANHFGAGDTLEEAIGRLSAEIAAYFSYGRR